MPDHGEVILARHGESELSVVGRTNGDPATACALTETGRQEARRLGQMLAPARIDLCVVSEFQRAQETADLALEAASPRLVLPRLERHPLRRLRGPCADRLPRLSACHGAGGARAGRGDSRAETVRRYIRGYRMILERPEPKILVVHTGCPCATSSMPTMAGIRPPPSRKFPTRSHSRLDARELAAAMERLEAWVEKPHWIVTGGR